MARPLGRNLEKRLRDSAHFIYDQYAFALLDADMPNPAPLLREAADSIAAVREWARRNAPLWGPTVELLAILDRRDNDE